MSDTKFSSWRYDAIEIEADSTRSFAFFDTKPNLFYIQNFNDTAIYIGVKTMPTVKAYEYMIPAHKSDAFGQPVQSNYLNIYNPSNEKIVIGCYSMYGTFDIQVLKDYSVSFDQIQVGQSIEFKTGVSLPAGSNEIGLVRLNTTQLKNITDLISSVITNTAKTGNIDSNVSSIITNLENILTKLGIKGDIYKKINTLVGIVNNSVINRLNDIENKKLNYNDFCQEISGSEITTINIGEEITKILTIINDGTTDILVKYFNSSEVQTGSHIIKSGEIFENIDIVGCYAVQITAKTSGGAYNCRVIGR